MNDKTKWDADPKSEDPDLNRGTNQLKEMSDDGGLKQNQDFAEVSTGNDQSFLGTRGSFEKIDSICRTFSFELEKGKPVLRDYLVQVAKDDQPTLLKNLLEYEVRNRRKAGQFPTAQEYIQLLPEFDGLIRRVFLDASSVSLASIMEPDAGETMTHAAPVASRLGDYRLVREIGRGGMGAVFEAIHLVRGHRVALKTLPAVSGESLHRFKREFRALSDVTHPNLVGLQTLENDGGQWFITLDLLDGCDFLSFVRPSGKLDKSRLRSALGQLAAGLMALHARGIVHRDLKPGNVMVTSQGRLVILDFGLVAEMDRSGVSMTSGMIAGTPAYMAPEQAAGNQVGPLADWYAFGVMLYEALSGSRPFSGDAFRIVRDKQQMDAPPLDANASAESDLAELCKLLLARDPNARPNPLQIAGVVASATPVMASNAQNADRLVGRESQFASLEEALLTFRRSASPVTVFIKGRSGEGKSSLAEAFLAPLRSDPSVVVMSGRCYDRESVPFKALDTLIDALTSHLRSLPAASAALLLPDDIGLLAEVFPVLRRCDVVAQAPARKVGCFRSTASTPASLCRSSTFVGSDRATDASRMVYRRPSMGGRRQCGRNV